MKAYGGHGTIAPHILKDIQKQYQRTAIQNPLFCYAHYETLKKTEHDRHLERNKKKTQKTKQNESKTKQVIHQYYA
jgi:ribosomal protein S24E